MKKFMTVLLVIAVMFTFSFSTAFAATTYYAADYEKALEEEMDLQMDYLKDAKKQALNICAAALDKDGFYDLEGTNYMKAAIEAAIDEAIEDLEDAMDEAVKGVIDNIPSAGVTNAPNRLVVRSITEDFLTGTALLAFIADDYTAELDKAQAPLTKAFVEGKIAVDYTKYNSTDKDANGLTVVDKIEALVDEVEDDIKDAAKETADSAKIAGYLAALDKFETGMEAFATLEDEGIADTEAGKTVEGAVNDYLAYGIETVYPALKVAKDDNLTNELAVAPYYEAKGTKGAVYFGVEVADKTKITKAEATAINNAIYAAIKASAEVVKVYADGDATKVEPLWSVDALVPGTDGYESLGNVIENVDAYKTVYGKVFYKVGNEYKESKDLVSGYEPLGKFASVEAWKVFYDAEYVLYWSQNGTTFTKSTATTSPNLALNYYTKPAEYFIKTGDAVNDSYVSVGDADKFIDTLGNAMQVAEVYAEVVELGEELKAEYVYGVKVYDDKKVDEAVADAEELVYADLAGTLDEAEDYLAEAAEGLASLRAQNYEIQALVEAIEDAQEKFIERAVKYGANKTAEADMVYVGEVYADADDWADIKEDAIAALEIAQSYAEIEEIMADAQADLAKLMLAADAEDVADAKEAYIGALEKYAELQAALADDEKITGTQIADTLEDGVALINKAITVKGVEAAYEDAKALFGKILTDDELDKMLEAVEDAIDELPYTSKITLADKAAVVAAFEAYVEYVETPGAERVSGVNALETKYAAVLDLEVEELNDAAEDLWDKLEDVKSGSDADTAAYLALKAEVEAFEALVDAFEAEVDAVKDAGFDYTIEYVEEVADVLATLTITNNDADYNTGVYYNKEMRDAASALVQAAKEGASVEAMKAAMAKYEALTDRQQYQLDDEVLTYIEIVSQKLAAVEAAEKEAKIAAVEGIKIKANSSAKKGSITVKWTVDEKVEGVKYQVYKSTKAQKGYKKSITTSKTSFKNTKNLEKGTRYFYKVRAIAEIDGVTYYSDWSNKANRIAK